MNVITKSPSQKVRMGVAGVGSLGQNHARIYAELEGVELVGLYDIDLPRAQNIAAQHGTQAFADLESLAKSCDALSVVVPTDLHFAVFKQLVEFNVHMLVEKPIAATTQEAEQMVAMAHDHNLILQVGHVERFNPIMSVLDAHLTSPKFIEVIRLAPYPPPRDGAPPRGTEVSVVLDLMIHDLEIILHLVNDELQDIHAVGVPVLSTTEDIANARLSFKNGCVANVTASRISMERMRKIRVFQEDTYVSLDYMNQSGHLHVKTPTGIETSEVPIEKRQPLTLELESFAECVRNQSTPVVSGSHASRALDLAVEICKRMRVSPS
ncbi:MAG: Gfo/Idh/MocA family oxidoreductase [Verrucomicrobia bacterium]|nr:Gfo/Idh/MocA family oxidoreductase [Verrucomicrobiota bacterium]